MRKVVLLTILVCGLAIAGCSNNAANNPDSGETSQAGEETAVPVTPAPDNTQPEATVPQAASPEDTPQDATASSTAAPAASPVNEQTPAASGTKQEYLAKLDAVGAGLKELQSLYDSGVTASMREAANEEYERWDKALNEIYTELKQQLSGSEMADLKEKQLAWITYRDKSAKEASLKFEGGTMEPLEYVSVLAGVTKGRCYELVGKYMK